MRLDELFRVQNGLASTTLKVHQEFTPTRLPFIRPASTQQRLVAGWVERHEVPSSKVFPAGSLIVSTNGEGSHTYSYVCPVEFVPNSDVAVLVPRQALNLRQKLFYARCITINRYRFSYGRKPKGSRLGGIQLPGTDEFPAWVAVPNSQPLVAMCQAAEGVAQRLEAPASPVTEGQDVPAPAATSTVPLGDLFEVSYGVNLELNRMTTNPKGIPFVARSRRNNGVTARVALDPNISPMPAGNITVAGGGNSVMAAFVQEEPYYSGRDLFTLTPKVPMTLRQKLYYCACITANRYRFNYGRQANRTLRALPLPALHTLPTWLNTAGEQSLSRLVATLDTLEDGLKGINSVADNFDCELS